MEQIYLWYNIIFIIPFGFAMLILLVMAIGVLPADLDMDLDFDHDFGADHDSSGFFRALSILGVGRVPLSIVFTTLFLLWGMFGMISNNVFEVLLNESSIYSLISITIALVGSVSLTSLISSFIARFLPNTESYSSSPEQLVGRVGEVLDLVDDKFGRVRIRDQFGTLIDVTCVVDVDEPPINTGEGVLLYNYDPKNNRYMGQLYNEQDNPGNRSLEQ